MGRIPKHEYLNARRKRKAQEGLWQALVGNEGGLIPGDQMKKLLGTLTPDEKYVLGYAMIFMPETAAKMCGIDVKYVYAVLQRARGLAPMMMERRKEILREIIERKEVEVAYKLDVDAVEPKDRARFMLDLQKTLELQGRERARELPAVAGAGGDVSEIVEQYSVTVRRKGGGAVAPAGAKDITGDVVDVTE